MYKVQNQLTYFSIYSTIRQDPQVVINPQIIKKNWSAPFSFELN